MSEPLIFEMGKHKAELPSGLLYAKNHMYAEPRDGGRLRLGFSAYAIRLMQDVYFLDWCVDVGDALAVKQEIGNVESSKAQSELFAPVAGTLTAVNGAVMADPSVINVDGYGDGWLLEVAAEPADLLDAQGYYDHLIGTWDYTQKVLKAQVNQG